MAGGCLLRSNREKSGILLSVSRNLSRHAVSLPAPGWDALTDGLSGRMWAWQFGPTDQHWFAAVTGVLRPKRRSRHL